MSLKPSNDTIAVLYDANYPASCSYETLLGFMPPGARLVSATELAGCLQQEEYTTLLSFHGPYFPKIAWTAILRFLEDGGNLAVFGGMPFTRPIDAEGVIEEEQQGYTDQIYLGASFPITLPVETVTLEPAGVARSLNWDMQAPASGQPGDFWSFYPKLTQANDHHEDSGSAGPLDTLLTPLLFACADVDGHKQRLATPFVLLDQRQGRFKGGRWLLSPWQPAVESDWLALAPAISQLLALVTEGASMVDLRPQFACYQLGELPTLMLSTRIAYAGRMHIELFAPDDTLLDTFDLELAPSPVLQQQRWPLSVYTEPGLYRVVASFSGPHEVPLYATTGFWIWDVALVKARSHECLSPGRDYFYRDGTLFPIFGTTYMDSRVQRKFLELPDPARWDVDFGEMRAAGINMIRTGLWTAWRDLMSVAGFANEAALRAMDAFVMTACKHDIQVMFTFFAFYPPLFEGENPWLDPRALEGQKDFVATFARRYADVALISWDLINEPSFGDPARIFTPRPIPGYDRFELAAFQRWLAQRYTLSELQLRWRQTPVDFAAWEQVTLPGIDDFSTAARDTTKRSMLKVMDYTLFSQEMFTNWAGMMREAIRAAGSPTLVGVGQDEAGARLSPQFHASAVDYTTTHPWWNNDDLLWDMLLDKTLETPNLIQEIGVMLVRDVDMRPWRSEQACADLLERKLITGLLARGAGLIQWLWHTNAYMTSDNENSIGLVRPDGSVKPELATMREVGRLMQALDGRLLEPDQLPETWVVIPYAQWFLRPELAVEATQQAVRVLGYDFGVVPQMVGEHLLAQLLEQAYRPRTIILPGAQLLTREAWTALQIFVERGATLLVSGVLTRDQHYLEHPLQLEGFDGMSRPVSRYEQLIDASGETHQVLYSADKMAYVRKAHNRLETVQRGAGTILWCGLPLELAQGSETLRRVYKQVLSQPCRDLRQDSPLLMVRRQLKTGVLVLLVSEASRACCATLDEDITIEVAPERAGAVIIDDNGEVQLFGGVTLAG